ncbi:MAG: FHA domain-containing protein [Bacteroidales bacterium]|jgi:hypothetical protein|nr:FHA domain-containing protein [Bacteroidales bacterium]
MTGKFKQCPNGHYYQEENCPYCKQSNYGVGSKTSLKTENFVGGGLSSQMPTKTDMLGGTKTTIIDEQETVAGNEKETVSGSMRPPSLSRTVFGDEPDVEYTPAGEKVEKKMYRSERKLVGWLVSYSFDSMGVDYKLYEGQNIIGRDINCNITVNDRMMSNKHATLLFRTGQYALKDEMSSHGTLVNGDNIGFEPHILKDGDEIRMGETTFKFRTSF